MDDPMRCGPPGPALEEAIDRLARAPGLLIASDYDGTLAPIVEDPDSAHPLRESIVALRTLAELPDTHVGVISGRALADLADLTRLSEAVHLVGSHGSEFEVGFAETLSQDKVDLRDRIHAELSAIAGSAPGFTLESKPASVAFHYRNADPERAKEAFDRIMAGPATLEGVHVKRGKMVLELGVVGLDKGTALRTLRQRLGAQAVIFIGDDATDEDAFKTLRGPDVGVKVGEGETAARYRVGDTGDVARLLAQVAEKRAAWLTGEAAVPIEHHAMLSDQRTVALLTPDARLTWMCVPSIDSPALFAELIGGPAAGYFAVSPADGAGAVSQSYLGDSLVVETIFDSFTVTDHLDCTNGRPRQRPGRTDLTRVIRGSGDVVIQFAPRLDFGRTRTRLDIRDGGVEVLDAPDPIVLYAPGVSWSLRSEGQHQTAVGRATLADDPLVVVLRSGSRTLRPSMTHALQRQEQTAAYWSNWADRLRLPKTARQHVLRSALTLRGLTYGPTGAIAAAATTSLPEWIGGIRNWDYRYAWPRDAAIAAKALVGLGSFGEAMHLLDWLLGLVESVSAPDRMRPIYTVSGGELPTEGEIGELPGYAGSRPVRVGNAAARQVQLDVFGPVVDLIHELTLHDAPLTPQHWRLAEAMVHAVSARWREEDHGIWEFRDEPRHHVHSRVMCWMTVDRAIRCAEMLLDGAPVGWIELRDEIAADVLEHGWSEKAGAFTCSYDQDEVDAGVLSVGLSGLLAPDDERFRATIDAVERDLRDGPVVYRYRFDDGLPGEEGGFHLCTCWLILAYIAVGRIRDARELFDAFLELVGPSGLMSEEYDPAARRALGNHPQAYSHAGLIECALALDALAD